MLLYSVTVWLLASTYPMTGSVTFSEKKKQQILAFYPFYLAANSKNYPNVALICTLNPKLVVMEFHLVQVRTKSRLRFRWTEISGFTVHAAVIALNSVEPLMSQARLVLLYSV